MPFGSEAFRPSDRVRRRPEYDRLHKEGRRVHTRHFVLLVGQLDPNQEHSRLGVTVSSRVGNAVVRNRVKRIVRDTFRRNRSWFGFGDYVVIARDTAAVLTSANWQTELRKVLARGAF